MQWLSLAAMKCERCCCAFFLKYIQQLKNKNCQWVIFFIFPLFVHSPSGNRGIVCFIVCTS